MTTTTSCDENFSGSEHYNDYYKAIKRDDSSSSQLDYMINHHQTPRTTIANIPVDSNASEQQPTTSTATAVAPKPMVTFKKQKLQKHRHGMLRHNQKQSEPNSTQTTATKCDLNCHKHCNTTATTTTATVTAQKTNSEILAMTPLVVNYTDNDTTNNNNNNMCQYHARLFESNRHYLYQKYRQHQQQNSRNQLHRQELRYDDEQQCQQEKDFDVEMIRDLRWIHWRMTLFMFYWIVWFIFLIGVIIIVALRAKQ